MDTPGFDPQRDLNDLERPLSRLRPASIGLSRERMLFEAGRASASAGRRRSAFAFTTAALSVAVVVLGGLLLHERSRRQALEVELAALPERPAPSRPGPSLSPPVLVASAVEASDSYLMLSRRIQAEGIEERRPSVAPSPEGRPLPDPNPPITPTRVRDAYPSLEF